LEAANADHSRLQEASPSKNSISELRQTLKQETQEDLEENERNAVSTIRGHFGRIKSSIDNKWIEYKEDVINTITPDIHKEIHRETARQLATHVRDSTDMDIRITQIEERATTPTTQRKMEERANKLENLTQELSQELKAAQDRTDSAQRRIDSLAATVRTQETDNQRESRPTRTATPDIEHREQRHPPTDAAGIHEPNYHETPTSPTHNRWNVDPETLGHRPHDTRSMPQARHQDREHHSREPDRDPHRPPPAWQDDEMTSDEQKAMTTSLRTFEKNGEIRELSDNPTLTEVETMYWHLSFAANSSGVWLRSLEFIVKGQPIHTEQATRSADDPISSL
jgi:hypothetical protein